MTIIHVTDVSTWGLYTKCMILQVTVGSTLCWYYLHNCLLWDWYNNSWLWLSTWISYYRINCSRLSISDMDRFCWVNFSLFVFDCYSALETCIETWIFDWELGLDTWIFIWDSHICRDGHVFITAKLLLNNVLYHQWFIVINIKLIIKWNLIEYLFHILYYTTVL